jgi:hypothetical protein
MISRAIIALCTVILISQCSIFAASRWERFFLFRELSLDDRAVVMEIGIGVGRVAET